jgi:hypothetical protein
MELLDTYFRVLGKSHNELSQIDVSSQSKLSLLQTLDPAAYTEDVEQEMKSLYKIQYAKIIVKKFFSLTIMRRKEW